MPAPSFERHGAMPPVSPVVLSVPHAGRDYPQALRAALRVSLAALLPLEDRHVDAVALAARTVQTLFVQTTPRAWIDLNRGEDERDAAIDAGAAVLAPAHQSAKLRSGLGLVPRRVGGSGEMWRQRFTDAEIVARIDDDHRPYHAALAAALAAARARFGVAVLLDVHSMPPLGGTAPARIVLGDRFGRSAAPAFVDAAEQAGDGVAIARNAPYAGGHILERHGRPDEGIHAIQLEIDRSLYLDRRFDRPGTGFAPTVALLHAIVGALEAAAIGPALATAAE